MKERRLTTRTSIWRTLVRSWEVGGITKLCCPAGSLCVSPGTLFHKVACDVQKISRKGRTAPTSRATWRERRL